MFYLAPDTLCDFSLVPGILPAAWQRKIIWVELTVVCLELFPWVFLWPSPDGTPFSKLDPSDPALPAKLLNWVPCIAYFAFDGFFLALTQALTRNQQNYGDALKGLLTVAGVINMAGGFAESVATKADFKSSIVNFFTPLSPTGQVLRIRPTKPKIAVKVVFNV